MSEELRTDSRKPLGKNAGAGKIECLLKKRLAERKESIMKKKADVVIVGTGVAGLFSALNLPDDKESS